MRKSIIVRGPVFSVSGYGEQTRFALRALRKRLDMFDIYLIPTSWGKTSWMSRINEEREWFDSMILKTAKYVDAGGAFDMSLQITIPNEWEKLAPINIGYTAGIETNMVAPEWIQKSKLMDKIIVVSEHSKQVYGGTVFEGKNEQNGEIHELRCTTPIDVVSFGIREITPDENFNLDLEYDFNYLVLSQWGPRKNIKKTVKWFLEECHDQEVGMILKLSVANNSIPDRHITNIKVNEIIQKFDLENPSMDRKCKIYVLHGDLKEEEIHALYKHPKIKALVTLTHGEGFGLPIFEAAYNNLPIIAPAWSGHLDYLYAPISGPGGGKKKIRPLFEAVDYNLQPIQKEAVWKGVLEENSMWCYPTAGSYKMKLRKVRNKYSAALKISKVLSEHIRDNFSEEKMHEKFTDSIIDQLENKVSPELDLGSVVVL
mgnify:CR=1 FL=1